MHPRTEKLLKQVQALPLTEVRDLIESLCYAEEWVLLDEGHTRCGGDRAVGGEVRCVGTMRVPARILRGEKNWTVTVQDQPVGTMPDRKGAQDLAEAELELRGYILPWRRKTV